MATGISESLLIKNHQIRMLPVGLCREQLSATIKNFYYCSRKRKSLDTLLTKPGDW